MSTDGNESDVNLTGSTASSVLTVVPDEPIESADIYGVAEMADDPRLEKAFDLIREVIADERAKTIADMLKGAKVPSSNAPSLFGPGISGISEKAQRAPAGSARVLCERALEEARNGGLTAMKIHDMAANEYEKMLSLSAVRNELAVGEKAKPSRYRNVGGVWYLTKYAPVMKIVG